MSLFSKILGFEKETFGLDIGYESLKIVQLKKKGAIFHLQGLGSAFIPKNTILKNAIKEKKAVAEAIKKVVSENHIHAKAVVSALPESVVFTKIITLPSMAKEELEHVVPQEVASFIPLEPEEAHVDFSIIGTSKEGKGEDIFVVASPKALVEDFVSLIELCGFSLLCLETKPLAITRALIQNEEEEGILILDLGALTTSMTIYNKGSIELTRTASIGGEFFTKALKEGLSVTFEEAEKIKRETNLLKMDEKIKKALEIPFSSLIEEISHSIKYYKDHKKPGQINEIRLCGGGANMQGLNSFIKDALGIETKKGFPWTDVENPPPLNTLEYTTAIGLAKREV